MAKNPQGVVPSDGSVSLFNKIISKTYADVYDTLEKASPTDAFRRKQTLNQIKEILDQADADTQAWVKLNIPGFYEMGMFETVKGINERGGVLNINNDFAHFHREAIEALSQETYATIASGMAGVYKNAVGIINNAAREGIFNKIAAGQITGETRDAVRKAIADELKKSGISALIDKGGKTWDLKRYGDMLARTSLTRAHNSGVINRMAGGGYDLVMVSSHYTSCDYCAPWQSEVLSVGGATPGFPTLKQAEGAGLFHPNCRHTYSPYHNDFVEKSVMWDTEQQKYVSYDEMKANNFYKDQFKVISKNEAGLFDYTKDSYMKRELFNSTIGMKTQYQFLPNVKLDGSMVLPKNMTTHIVDDMGRKIEMRYPELKDNGILAKFHSALDGKDYKTLEDLHSDLSTLAKSLGVPADPFKTRLANVESVYLNAGKAKIEKLAVLDPKTGSVLFANVGVSNKVGVPRDRWGRLKDNVLIHNHPNSTSFSLEDLLLASKMNVSQIKAIGGQYSYELIRPASGWNASANEIRKMYQTAVDTLSKEIQSMAAEKTIAGTTLEATHLITQQVAEVFGWEYKRY